MILLGHSRGMEDKVQSHNGRVNNIVYFTLIDRSYDNDTIFNLLELKRNGITTIFCYTEG
ncbi:hypothetical protein J2S09_004288 [Bacillus fengqiuensis]|nr:hypothetical protein [Bacillus fengqiuensis]